MIGNGVAASHLNAVFGAVEIFDELIALTGDRDFERAWLDTASCTTRRRTNSAAAWASRMAAPTPSTWAIRA